MLVKFRLKAGSSRLGVQTDHKRRQGLIRCAGHAGICEPAARGELAACIYTVIIVSQRFLEHLIQQALLHVYLHTILVT